MTSRVPRGAKILSQGGRWSRALFLVAVGGLGTFLVEDNLARASEAKYVLKALVFGAMDLITAHSRTLGLCNAGIAVLLLTVQDDSKNIARRLVSRLVLLLNRSVGNLEALFTWFTLAVWWGPSLWLQTIWVLGIAVLGPLAIDALTRGTGGSPSRWRGVVPMVVTLTGLALVLKVDWLQVDLVLPLVAMVLAGLLPRTAWTLWKDRSLHEESGPAEGWPLFIDRLALAGAVGAALIIPLSALKSGHRASLENRLRRTRHWPSCLPAEATPASFGLFIVADNQFHALDGKRSGFHLDMVDTEVPVSVRPVELDLLSSVTLRAFAGVYLKLRESRPELQWAHLGDGADIGCRTEVDRFVRLASRFGLGSLAAAIPGNHDGAFLGNLAWHPDWDQACPGGRSSPRFARERLATLMPPRAGRMVSPPGAFLAGC